MGVLRTVLGTLNPQDAGIVDGHTHVWIEDIGAIGDTPLVLNQQVQIEKELRDFVTAGGRTMVDCQPFGCGRDGNKLREISNNTGVNIIACTGFHLRKHYPKHAPIFEMTTAQAHQQFVGELEHGLQEAPDIQAGFIKIACEATLDSSPKHLIEAAVQASIETNAAIEVHTERGTDAEAIADFMLRLGLSPQKLILCHMAKRFDVGLHQSLADRGILLEYDSFIRPKYDPDNTSWVLLFEMLEAGYENNIILATDLAEAHLWQHIGGGVGAVALIEIIKYRLEKAGVSDDVSSKLLGANVAQALLF